MVRSRLFSLYSFLLLSSLAFSQCYDLRSTYLYEPQGRFQEWWDKPLWNGQTGNENLHIDEPTWGRVLHFALFDIGIVRRTPDGWVPYKATRKPDTWCDPAPERSGLFCYSTPYQKPSLAAKIHAPGYGVETWSLDSNGIVDFRYHDPRGIPAKIENGSDYKLLPHEFGFSGKDETDATLDLNTGDYKFESHGYGNGFYIRRYPGTGVQIWRIDTFQAKAVLQEIPCPASVNTVALSRKAQKTPTIELKDSQVCAVKITKATGDELEAKPTAWEFVQNPRQVSLPDKCIKVFEKPLPSSKDSAASTSSAHAQSQATSK